MSGLNGGDAQARLLQLMQVAKAHRSDDPAPRSGTPSTGGTPLEAHRQEKSVS